MALERSSQNVFALTLSERASSYSSSLPSQPVRLVSPSGGALLWRPWRGLAPGSLALAGERTKRCASIGRIVHLAPSCFLGKPINFHGITPKSNSGKSWRKWGLKPRNSGFELGFWRHLRDETDTICAVASGWHGWSSAAENVVSHCFIVN